MRKLIEGVLRFQHDVYPGNRELYAELAEGQSPRWLLITCSDSRVVPSIMAQVGPGALFMCRNAGNIVPAHGEHSGGVAATIEYAVEVLKVRHIIVCGHSDCGAMKAVLDPDSVAHLPAVSHWVSYAARARAITRQVAAHASDEEQMALVTRENVHTQLDNLRTLPCVATGLRGGTVGIHGWVYDIRGGTFDAWDEHAEQWVPIENTIDSDSAEHAA